MAINRMQNWDTSDFSHSFRYSAERSDNPLFREKFLALADALEPLEREFIHETAGCGLDLSGVLSEVRDIASRMNYCDRDRRMQHTCESIYAEVDETVRHIQQLREVCFS